MDGNDKIKYRKEVSRLIYQVLTDKIVVREAVLNFPKVVGDKTLDTVYHALVHYEADEDLRKRDLLYKEVQNDYLEFIAETLDKGDDLPLNIIDSYKKYYKDTNLPKPKTMSGLLKSLCKFLNV